MIPLLGNTTRTTGSQHAGSRLHLGPSHILKMSRRKEEERKGRRIEKQNEKTMGRRTRRKRTADYQEPRLTYPIQTQTMQDCPVTTRGSVPWGSKASEAATDVEWLSCQALQSSPRLTRLSWWERLTVTTSVRTEGLATLWRPAAADLSQLPGPAEEIEEELEVHFVQRIPLMQSSNWQILKISSSSVESLTLM